MLTCIHIMQYIIVKGGLTTYYTYLTLCASSLKFICLFSAINEKIILNLSFLSSLIKKENCAKFEWTASHFDIFTSALGIDCR